MNTKAHWIEESLHLGKAKLSQKGALIVETGKHTGRAVNSRFISDRPESFSKIAWSKTNQKIDATRANQFLESLEKKLSSSEIKTYTYSGFVGPFPIEVQSSSSWHMVFCDNMFRKTPSFELKTDKKIKIFHLPYHQVKDLGIDQEDQTLLVLDPEALKVGIVGTAYAGEIKKSAFTLCNYLLPDFELLSMHSSANCLEDGSESCVLFGLSGTGKTTLSASPDRFLIGDDEIVWSNSGLSNLEGGCYAKLIDLSLESEPEIFRAVNQFGSILENVGFGDETREIDFSDRSKTENTRGSYSLKALDKIFSSQKEAQAPKNIVFLMADAFGAMPAAAKLNPLQAQYYFISGYTAKVAGTELGVKEPQAAFSTCFGAPFMPRPSSLYASLLADLAQRSGAQFWLLNTGWMAGGYGKSQRYPLSVSRRLLAEMQSGRLAQQKTKTHPVFNFEVPVACPDLDSKYLEFDNVDRAKDLAKKFESNIQNFAPAMTQDCLQRGGPISA